MIMETTMNTENTKKKAGICVRIKDLIRTKEFWYFAIPVILAIAFFAFEHTKPRADLQKEILTNIESIKQEFHPNAIPSEFDSIPFVNTYKGFITNVMDLCDEWILLENQLSHAEPANYNDFDVSSCKGRLELYQKGMKDMDNQMMVTVMNIMTLSIGAEAFNVKSNWKINTDEFGYLTNLVKLKETTIKKYLTKASLYIGKGKLKEGMMEIDKMKKDNDYLRFDDALFKYCIQVKECCDHILKDNGIHY